MRNYSFAIFAFGVMKNLTYGFSSISVTPITKNSLSFRRNFFTPSSSLAENNEFTKNLVKETETVLNISHGGSTDTNTTGISVGKFASSFWGAFGVVYILSKAIKRVIPIALEPFSSGAGAVPLTTFQLAAYVGTCLFFAYAEGYKGFQRKFSPLVVSRSMTLTPFSWSKLHHVILAPLYSMGLFHATKKRKITSWSVSIGVATIVALVKKFPYPWRNIVDAGVVVGLSWGSLSIIFGYLKAILNGGVLEGVDNDLPGM